MLPVEEDQFDDGPQGLPLEEPFDASPFDDEEADAGGTSGKLSIFVSHSCEVEPDRTIALSLYRDLSPYSDVYVNTTRLKGERFDEEITGWLNRADFVIALLSRQSNESEWVRWELTRAALRFKRTKQRPVVIPVLLGLGIDDLSNRIGAAVAGFNPWRADPADYAGLLAQVQAVIEGGLPPIDLSVASLEGFEVGEYRKSLTRAASPDSAELRRACASLCTNQLLWVVGDPGVRNHFARALAVREHDREAAAAREQGKGPHVYEVTRSLGWSKADDTLVGGAVLVFNDVTPSALFDEESSRDELKSLRRLAERNLVILTASEESYDEIEQEMRNREFAGGGRVNVGRDFYGEPAKLDIFGRLLKFSLDAGDITHRQHRWARRLLEDAEARETFRAVVRKWSPSDLERFVTRHLRDARREGDVLRLLQRNADLDDEIHAWFVGLDDSARCFILTLAMLSGLGAEQLWEKYKLVVGHLRSLDARLALWPLGICRQRAAPYVTTEGQLHFVDARIADAVQREVTDSFREYLVELVPLLKEARFVPADGGREVRTAVARLLGRAGRRGLEEQFRGLLAFWGEDPAFQVREAVAVALEQAARERAGAGHALGLLEGWCNVASGNQKTFYRAAAASSALASVAAANAAGGETRERALALLRRLAAYKGLRGYVSIALKKAARKLPLAEDDSPVGLAALLRAVAGDSKASTRINVGEALNEARAADEQRGRGEAEALVREWAAGDEADCRWAAICSLLLWRRQRQDERVRVAAEFLARDPETTASVLVELVNSKYARTKIFEKCLLQLARATDGATRAALVAGLAALSQAGVEARLMPLLRAAEEAELSGLAVEVRAERWRRMLPAPAEFVADLRKELRVEGMSAEIYQALAALLRPEPWGQWDEAVRSLVGCFAVERPALDDALARLEAIAPALFEPLSVEVRREGLRCLLHDPPAFVAAAAEGLAPGGPERATAEALAALARPEPQGSGQELLRVLADAHALVPAEAFALLQQFRASGHPALVQLAYELNLRSLEGDVGDAGRFLSRVVEMMRYAPQRAEVLRALQHLSTPEPEGRRRDLVRALGAARVARRSEVDALLSEPEWQSPGGTFGLGIEIKLFSYLSQISSPGFAAAVFNLVT